MKIIKIMSVIRLLAILLGLSAGGLVGHVRADEQKAGVKIEARSETEDPKSETKKSEKDDDDKDEEHEDKDGEDDDKD